MSATLITAERPISGHTTRREKTRSKLIEAGTELFAEHGLGPVTSTAIAQRAGVATGTFYLHFEDKHALFEVLVDDALAEIRAQFSLDIDSRKDDARRTEIEAMVAVVERRRDLVRAVFDRGENTEIAERVRNQIARRLEANYAELFAERNISMHPGAAAEARAAVLVRVIAWWAEDPSRATRTDVVDVLLELDPLRIGGGFNTPTAAN